LGLPKYTPEANIPRIDATMLRSFTKEFYQPERMVLAGVGIDHQQLIALGQKYFAVPKNQTKSSEMSKAVWTGGALLVRGETQVSYRHVSIHSLLGRT
jgi:mitochondrial-processing peptidase subunit alpha